MDANRRADTIREMMLLGLLVAPFSSVLWFLPGPLIHLGMQLLFPVASHLRTILVRFV